MRSRPPCRRRRAAPRPSVCCGPVVRLHVLRLHALGVLVPPGVFVLGFWSGFAALVRGSDPAVVVVRPGAPAGSAH